MAIFQKTPDGGPDGPFETFTPEVLGQFAGTFWPAILGGITLFVLILLGKERAAIPVAVVAVLLQAWRLGLFG